MRGDTRRGGARDESGAETVASIPLWIERPHQGLVAGLHRCRACRTDRALDDPRHALGWLISAPPVAPEIEIVAFDEDMRSLGGRRCVHHSHSAELGADACRRWLAQVAPI